MTPTTQATSRLAPLAAPQQVATPEHALTILQPWAWAIVAGWKQIENRSWQPTLNGQPFRGWLAIHAGTSLRECTYENDCLLKTAHPLIKKAMYAKWITPERQLFEIGGFIGVARVVDCLHFDGSLDSQSRLCDAVEAAGIDYDGKVSPIVWASGEFCWILADAVKFPKMIPARGKLNLWKIEESDRRKIAAAIADMRATNGRGR